MNSSRLQAHMERLRLAYGATMYWLTRAAATPKVFILSTGRAGAHWLAHLLDAHPNVFLGSEKQSLADWISAIDAFPERRETVLPKLVRHYRYEHAVVAPKLYIDTHHAHVWIAEHLAEAFAEARFIAIRRNVFASVASMLRHHDHRPAPPARFLDMKLEAAGDAERLPPAARYALHWRARVQRLDELKPVLGNRYCTISYEALHGDPRGTLEELASFLGLAEPIPLPQIDHEPLYRWRSELRHDQIESIRGICGESAAWRG